MHQKKEVECNLLLMTSLGTQLILEEEEDDDMTKKMRIE